MMGFTVKRSDDFNARLKPVNPAELKTLFFPEDNFVRKI
jgi:hypothetical protein